jgi:tetratricopeptide (TPR) repeat protein
VPALRDCADADFVWTVEPPAAGISADVARANDEVDFSIAATVAGNPTGSATRLDRAMELAHQSGYEPLIARVLLEKGWTLRHDDPIDAIAKLQQAFGVAEQGGADATAADIASALVLLAAFTGRSEMGNSWNDVAIAKLERIEARPMRRAIHARAAAELALVRREPEAALALVDTMLVYAREAAGEGRLIEGDALGLRARVIELVGTEAEALEAHAVSLYASRELYGDEHPSYATGLWNRGLFLSSIGDFESAMTDFGAAAGLLHGSGERGLLLSLHVAWARAASMSGGVPANLLGRVVELQDALPETHPDRQDAMSMVATELLADGQAERALKLFERVVAVKRELDEFDAVDLALAESNVGECLLELERWSEAERRFTRSLLVLERELGPDDALLAYALTGLGRALTGLDSTVDALPLLERSWELLEDEAADRRLLAQTATALARLSPPKRAEALLSRAEEYFGQLKRQTNR